LTLIVQTNLHENGEAFSPAGIYSRKAGLPRHLIFIELWIKETEYMFGKKSDHKEQLERVIAAFETNLGTFEAELYARECPETVWNFVKLAEGRRQMPSYLTARSILKNRYAGLVKVLKAFADEMM